jgi:hypothetical protein
LEVLQVGCLIREEDFVSQNKTVETDASVAEFINAVDDDVKREDSWKLVEIMQQVTGEPPRMWGPSIVGFGTYHYVYESGREGDMPVVGFSPRKAALTLYINSKSGWEAHADLMESLGKHKVGKGCLYIKRLSDVDMEKLAGLIERSAKDYS